MGIYLLFTSNSSTSSRYHVMVESLRTLKNWHQSFKCPVASEKGSPLILRITWGAGRATLREKRGGGGKVGSGWRGRACALCSVHPATSNKVKIYCKLSNVTTSTLSSFCIIPLEAAATMTANTCCLSVSGTSSGPLKAYVQLTHLRVLQFS